ncbi:hypothetical protein M501DRAFT_714818 [Patellaria atrata CBS 101060]|uniref:Secreted protein n=1 Tax=Patellaria atrata CBS 101060 TaxID=1346257 RepID=A0A9P4SD24_9PEZI|nr:hypothetical protein M501DRAFT_714818 [Patellaria atrata CBS 101060]
MYGLLGFLLGMGTLWLHHCMYGRNGKKGFGLIPPPTGTLQREVPCRFRHGASFSLLRFVFEYRIWCLGWSRETLCHTTPVIIVIRNRNLPSWPLVTLREASCPLCSYYQKDHEVMEVKKNHEVEKCLPVPYLPRPSA